jgi:hypothetical protein
MKFLKRKGIAMLAVAAVVAATAVGALAYFTNSGSGTGTASVGTSSAIAVSGSPVDTLYPGGADASVAVTISNSGSAGQFVNQISGSVADNGACLGSWFQVDTATYGKALAGGASDTLNTKVRMLDSGTNQDVCKSKTMTINWSSN